MRQRGWIIALLILSELLALTPRIGGTFALLSARTANPNAIFATTALYAPGTLQGSPGGRDGALSWAAGQNGSGYKVLGLSNGTSSTCPAYTSPSYTAIGTTTGLSYTDANRSPASVPQGNWYCYQVQTTYQSWNSVQSNPVVGVQVGVVAVSVQLVNGGVAGTLDTGDKIIFTFNQAITPSTGPSGTNSVCSNAAGTVWVGSTATTGSCATTETVSGGKLTGGTLDRNARWSATYVWSNGNKTLTVTLGTRTVGNRSPVMSVATWMFTPTTTSTKLLSSIGGFHICDNNTGGGNCTPSTAPGTANPFGAESIVPAATAAATATATPASAIVPTYTPTPKATHKPGFTPTATGTPRVISASPTSPPAPSPSRTEAVAPASPSPTTKAITTAMVTRTTAPSTTPRATRTLRSTPTASATATVTATAVRTRRAGLPSSRTAEPTQTVPGASPTPSPTLAQRTASPTRSRDKKQPVASPTASATPNVPQTKVVPTSQPRH